MQHITQNALKLETRAFAHADYYQFSSFFISSFETSCAHSEQQALIIKII